METDKLVSVIIPICNVEPYLKRCIDSIINQTYKELEIILINDGSTDNSFSICKEYSKIDKRIKLITQENLGVSASRNKGIEVVTGQYVFFVDSDDYVELNAIEKMIEVYKSYDTDLIIAGFISEVDMGEGKLKQDNITYNSYYYKNKKEININIVELWDTHMLYNIFNKLYKANIITENNIKFPNYNWGEDLDFNKKYMQYVNKLNLIEDCIYHYVRERKGAATNTYKPNLFEIRLKENKDFINYFQSIELKEEQYIEFVARRYIERTLGCIENICSDDCKLGMLQKYKEVKNIITHEETKKYLKMAKLKSKKMKILTMPYKIKSTLLVMLECTMIALLRKTRPDFFNKLKNAR